MAHRSTDPDHPITRRSLPSGFAKHRASSVVTAAHLGIISDEQADPRVHGGPRKVVYGCAFAHHAVSRREYPQHTNQLISGGLGENLLIEGIPDAELWPR
jgi:MOSC domain-containing protein YiiM